MLSDQRVQSLADRFVCVKVDPRETRDAMEHKETRYVPEIVLLDSEASRLVRVEGREVETFTSAMEEALRANRE